MTIEQLQQLAFDFGFGGANVSQTQLIRTIQLRRGGEPCYLSERRYGCKKTCEWSGECRKLKAQWKC